MNNYMSDSQFMRFQKKKLEKIEKSINSLENQSRVEMLRSRFESSKHKDKTLWQKILSLFKK